MTRSPRDRLIDIAVACDAIAFDAVRIRLVEIGEAVKDFDADTIAGEPGIPWMDIARMRDLLTHRYFDTTHAIVAATARQDLPRLADAVRRLLA